MVSFSSFSSFPFPRCGNFIIFVHFIQEILILPLSFFHFTK